MMMMMMMMMPPLKELKMHNCLTVDEDGTQNSQQTHTIDLRSKIYQTYSQNMEQL